MNNTHARVNSERKWQPRLRCQTESRYVQTVPDRKCLCPDTPRRKVPMSRISCVHRAFKSPHVQTFVRSKLPMSRLSCVQNTLCRDLRAFKTAYVRNFVCSKPKIVRCNIVILCVFVETILISKDFMSRLWEWVNGI